MKKKYVVLVAATMLCGLMTVSAAAEPESVTITDQLGREVTVNLPVESCYLGFYYENFLTVVGPDAFTKVKATSLYDTEGYFASLSEMYRENVEGYADMVDVGSTMQDNFDVEKLIEMDVDVAIVGNYQYEGAPEAMEKLEEAGIPVVAINYSACTVEEHTAATKILGEIFQVEDRAQEILDLYTAGHEGIAARTAEIQNKKTTFHEYHTAMDSYHELGFSDSPYTLFGSYLKEGGGDDIMNLVWKEGQEGSGTYLDLEFLLEQDPDTIFIMGGGKSNSNADGFRMGYHVTEDEFLESTKGMVEARPGYDQLQAVKNNQIYCIDDGVLRTLRDYCVVEYIAKNLYPDEFQDLDPEADIKAFTEKYLPSLPQEGIFFHQYSYED